MTGPAQRAVKSVTISIRGAGVDEHALELGGRQSCGRPTSIAAFGLYDAGRHVERDHARMLASA